MSDRSDEIDHFLDGVVGVVEANDFERQMLWEANQRETEHKKEWISYGLGYGPIVGELDGRPVCISIACALIGGRRILFYDGVSQVVDHLMIEEWLDLHLPITAFRKRSGQPVRINRVDAANFHNVFD